MYLYDVLTEPVKFVNHYDQGYTDFDYDNIRLIAVAKNRYQAMKLVIQFVQDVYGAGVKVSKHTKMSVRKITPAWANATPECNWISTFEHTCMEPREYALTNPGMSALDALCYDTTPDDLDDRHWALGTGGR